MANRTAQKGGSRGGNRQASRAQQQKSPEKRRQRFEGRNRFSSSLEEAGSRDYQEEGAGTRKSSGRVQRVQEERCPTCGGSAADEGQFGRGSSRSYARKGEEKPEELDEAMEEADEPEMKERFDAEEEREQ